MCVRESVCVFVCAGVCVQVCVCAGVCVRASASYTVMCVPGLVLATTMRASRARTVTTSLAAAG